MKQKGHCVRRGRIINKRRGGETGAGGRGWESNIVYNDIYVGRCHNRAYCSVCQQKKLSEKKQQTKNVQCYFEYKILASAWDGIANEPWTPLMRAHRRCCTGTDPDLRRKSEVAARVENRLV